MPSSDLLPGKNLLSAAVLMEGGLGVLAIAIGWLIGWDVIGMTRFQWPAVLWGVAGAAPMLLLLLACTEIPRWPFSDIAEVVDRLLRPLFAQATLAELALISALAGIGEEMFFRGLLQEGLAQWIGEPYGPIAGLAAASLVFGLLHPINSAYVVLAATMGLFLGGLWMISGNLLVPIITHGLYDFLALVWLVKIYPPRQG